MSKANETQVGGDHYKTPIEHWDWVIANGLSYMQGQITKYVARYTKKNGLEDLYKARHFLDKLIEVEEAKKLPARATDGGPNPHYKGHRADNSLVNGEPDQRYVDQG